MTVIGYHCSHEQHPPSELLRYVQLAERVGFEAAMCSDHFAPWSEAGHGGFAWSWLGAALQATDLSFGMVCAPGQRYHPAIIAQAAATLAEMYPGRLWCSFGSGQNLNEHITGEGWPEKGVRQARLLECVQVMRALWAGETVNHRGHVVVEEAKLYTRPATPLLIFGAAISSETAECVGSWADGIITVAKPPDDQRRFIEAFRRGGGAGKPMILQALLSYAPTKEAALQGAWERWRNNSFGARIQAELKTPQDFDLVGNHVRLEDIDKSYRVSADLEEHIAWLQGDIDLGFERIYLYTAMPDQAAFLKTFGEQVLPRLKRAKPLQTR